MNFGYGKYKGNVMELLLAGAPQEAILAYCTQAVEPLRLVDEGRHMEYEKTLRTYLNCGNDMVRTSKVLYIHRNTVVQRLRRIDELLGTDVNLPEVRNEYMNIFAALSYFSGQEGGRRAAQ